MGRIEYAHRQSNRQREKSIPYRDEGVYDYPLHRVERVS